MCFIFEKKTSRTEIVLGECNEYQNLAQNSEIYVLNSKAAENYVRHFINGKKLRIASVEVRSCTSKLLKVLL